MIPDYHSDDFSTARLEDTVSLRSAAGEARATLYTVLNRLTSYLSLLMTSGLKQWSNPAIDRVTQSSDFDFRDIRKTPFSVYLVVEPLMVKPLAPLIRLFFSDLLASLQDHEPGIGHILGNDAKARFREERPFLTYVECAKEAE